MTEEEAKTKWCPFARVAVGWETTHGTQCGFISANRVTGSEIVASEAKIRSSPESARCIGSACMAWRISVEAKPGALSPNRMTRIPAEPAQGYCGLAGKP